MREIPGWLLEETVSTGHVAGSRCRGTEVGCVACWEALSTLVDSSPSLDPFPGPAWLSPAPVVPRPSAVGGSIRVEIHIYLCNSLINVLFPRGPQEGKKSMFY